MLLSSPRLPGRCLGLLRPLLARGYRGEAVAAVGSRPDASSAVYQVGRRGWRGAGRGGGGRAGRAAGRGGGGHGGAGTAGHDGRDGRVLFTGPVLRSRSYSRSLRAPATLPESPGLCFCGLSVPIPCEINVAWGSRLPRDGYFCTFRSVCRLLLHFRPVDTLQVRWKRGLRTVENGAR